MRRLLTLAFLLIPLLSTRTAPAASTTLVISEFRTRGPNGANDEFIEIFNTSNAAINLAGFSLRVSDSAGNTAALATVAAGVLLPRHFYLFVNTGSQGYSGTTAGTATYTISVPDDGGIALVDAASKVVDAVGMSAGSAYVEGTPLAPMSTNVNQSYERNNGGCAATQDTDVNATDFRFNATTSGPNNTLTNCNSCVGVVCNAPPNGQCYVSPGTCAAGTCNYTRRATGFGCTDGDACTASDKCDAAGACISGAPVTCNTPPPASCSDPKTLVTYASSGTCSSIVGCTYVKTSTPCTFGCNGTTAQCNPDPCTNVSCNSPPTNGCYDAAGTCVGGSCVYAKKAASTPCTDGNACTTGDVCDAAGQCLPGAATPIDDTNPCTADSCDTSSGTVSHAPVTDGTSCDDGNLCNGIATCQTGACTNGAPVSCTTPPVGGCYAGAGTCNPVNGACTYQPLTQATTCDDGDACTTQDQCDGNGTCAGSTVVCSAAAATCTDSTTSRTFQVGTCQAGSGTCDAPHTDAVCAFGCDGTSGLCAKDPCIGKVCSTPPSGCHDPAGTCANGVCSYALKPGGASCDDGDPCTTVDQCSAAGACSGTPLLCNTPPLPSCKDASTSTQPDVTGTCSSGACSYQSTDVACQFGCDPASGLCKGDPCGGVTCDTPPSQCHQALGTCAAGVCTYELKPANSNCDDGNPCTVSDVCDAAGACAGAAKECNAPPVDTCLDPNDSRTFATSGTCDGTGTCVYAPTDSACANGCDSATGLCKGDPCATVVCVTPPSACDLDTGTCVAGTCGYAHRAAGVPCDDANACTTNDACDGSGACVGTPVVSCGVADAGTGGATSGTGGSSSTDAGAGGSTSTGGAASADASAGGSTSAPDGGPSSGGSASAGGSASTGGSTSAGGSTGTGGSGGGTTTGSGTTGGAAASSGGAPGTTTDAGAGGSSGAISGDKGGCGCSVPRSTNGAPWPLAALAVAAVALRRKKRR